MPKKRRLRTLFNHFINGVSSEKEDREFMKVVNDGEYEEFLKDLMDEYLASHKGSEGMEEDQKAKILNRIFQYGNRDLQEKSKKPMVLRLRPMLAAAVLFLVASIAAVIFYNQGSHEVSYSKYQGKLMPGGNKATLTLASGQQISLPEIHIGDVVSQAGVSITKTKDGQVIYKLGQDQSLGSDPKNKTQYNTISTPAGGQYQLVLSDGTRVWLNSSSSLKYPISHFGLGERRVELHGEAYFEVAKLKSGSVHIPFIVESKGQDVQVLGTHFNVKSYDEEDLTTTTLLEGRVRVSRPHAFQEILEPGQQAQVNQFIKVLNVDTSTAVAWKNGLFKFEDASIQSVMEQFSRWYDVDVAYEGTAPHHKFTGEIYRNMDAAKAFKLLSYADIKFRIEVPADKGARKRIVIVSN
jgi:transmembrane sensor